MAYSRPVNNFSRLSQITIILGMVLIVVRLCLWHVYLDKNDKRDRKFIQGKEAVTGMHCANDRSRWATVVALVHHHTFAIDEVDPLRGKHGNWGTIDKVYHADKSGTERFYSSKPPLYNLVLAGQYWIIHAVTGLNILEHPMPIIKLLTLVNQGIPLLVILICLAKVGTEIIENRRLYSLYLVAITFGTFLTTFAVTLNNHIPAALFALLAILECRQLVNDTSNSKSYAIVGLYAALCVTFELPALALLLLLGIWCLTLDFKRTIAFGVPPILLVATIYLGINKVAHDSWRPPYAHRADNTVLEVLSIEDGDSLLSGILPDNVDLFSGSMPGIGNYRIEPHPSDGRWRIYDYGNNVRYAMLRKESTYEIRGWDNWYDYEVNGRKSYWLPGQASGVDLGESSRVTYLFNLTIGHHGFFSLSPILLFGLAGIFSQLRTKNSFWKPLARITLALTVILLIFYVLRPLQDRNYGGVASGFRWMFWLIPLYSLFLAKCIHSSRRSFFLLLIFLIALVVSIYSAHYGFLNPWQNPWPYSN